MRIFHWRIHSIQIISKGVHSINRCNTYIAYIIIFDRLKPLLTHTYNKIHDRLSWVIVSKTKITRDFFSNIPKSQKVHHFIFKKKKNSLCLRLIKSFCPIDFQLSIRYRNLRNKVIKEK